MPGQAVGNIWLDIPPVNSQAKERVGYPTQKPLALLRRIFEASSNENDMVLDPFCGCANACIAVETHQRQWAGIDISPKAADLFKSRVQDELVSCHKLNVGYRRSSLMRASFAVNCQLTVASN